MGTYGEVRAFSGALYLFSKIICICPGYFRSSQFCVNQIRVLYIPRFVYDQKIKLRNATREGRQSRIVLDAGHFPLLPSYTKSLVPFLLLLYALKCLVLRAVAANVLLSFSCSGVLTRSVNGPVSQKKPASSAALIVSEKIGASEKSRSATSRRPLESPGSEGVASTDGVRAGAESFHRSRVPYK